MSPARDVLLLQTGLPGWTLDLFYHFALSETVNGPCSEHLDIFRCCETLPWFGWALLFWDHPQWADIQNQFYALCKFSKIGKDEVNIEVQNLTNSKERAKVK